MRGKQLSLKIVEKGDQIGSVLIQLNRKSWAAFRTMQVYFKFVSGYPRMVFIPMLLLTCTAYGLHSVKRSTIPRQIISPSVEETSLTDLASLKNWVIANSVSAVTDILAGPEVQKEGVRYLERLFMHKQLHTALLKLLNGAIQDKRFEHDSALFG